METPANVSEEEEYIDIDMELCSSSPQTIDFEFPMSVCTPNPTTADDLFFKGKLLPLHLPPRRLMLQTLLSPSESRRLSCELSPHDYFFEWSTELSNRPAEELTRSKKLKKSLLEASRTFLRSFFLGANSRRSGNKAFGDVEERRRSFSGAIKRHSPSKCLSSSSSSNSSSSSSSSSLSLHSIELLSLRRSSSVTEIEGSIQDAIAHCKKTCSLIGDEESRKRPVF